jgi:hypothetical protein
MAKAVASPAPVTITLTGIAPDTSNSPAFAPSFSLSFIGADPKATTYLEVLEGPLIVIDSNDVQATRTATEVGTAVIGDNFFSYTRAPSSDVPYALSEYCTVDGNGNDVCSFVLVPSGAETSDRLAFTHVTTGVVTAIAMVVVDVPDRQAQASGGTGGTAGLRAVLTSIAGAVVGVLLVGGV